MKEYVINNVVEYLEKINNLISFAYRGVSKKEYKLIPSMARGWATIPEMKDYFEQHNLSEFKKMAVSQLDGGYQPANDWEWPILGQHHGLRTRLLDWSTNPLVALFFAVSEDKEFDGAVYSFIGLGMVTPIKIPDHQLIDKDYFVNPPYLSSRISAQSSCFTISQRPLHPTRRKVWWQKDEF